MTASKSYPRSTVTMVPTCLKRAMVLLVAFGMMAHCQRMEEDLVAEETDILEAQALDSPAVAAYWTTVGGTYIIRMSVGRCGVWVVNIYYSVFYRSNTYDSPKSLGDAWLGVPNDKLLKIRQVSVGYSTVWAINQYYGVYYREGITASKPRGDKWVKLSDNTKIKWITVTQKGHVWGLSSSQKVMYREGASNTNIAGTEWKTVSGVLLDTITAGKSGVWGLNYGLTRKVWYREGTYGDPETNTVGSKWTDVQGVFNYICAGDDKVYGANYTSEIFYRNGMTAASPVGSNWGQTETGVNGLYHVAYVKDVLWAIDYSYTVRAKVF
ncbi:tectonin beta-propeller repeat-containing protein 1-like [Patiria miniata]|uniref:Uncharacterized protein n=1 Tax=Patiria miniata TaxID=46514 RepID=A0A913ZYD0_PATMI|nr:tectonin beta-propeller repeat-containing protein 1-like [Patiria miniata]XP_038056648.1 tectonin beta-propeller repeat-containing protein 1-like [Patiria miniata]